MNELFDKIWKSGVWFCVSATFIFTGFIVLVGDLTWIQFPKVYAQDPNSPSISPSLNAFGLWFLGIGLAVDALVVIRLTHTAPDPKDENYSKIMFGRCLVGIGFVLLLDALLNVVAVAGFAKAGAIGDLFPATVSLRGIPLEKLILLLQLLLQHL